MLAVYKYKVPIQDRFTLELPYTRRFLDFQAQGESLQIWMLIDPKDDHKIECNFRLAGTGHAIEEPDYRLNYRGTCQMHQGALVLHLFEII